MASPSSVISLGLGSWGSQSLVVTLGLGVGEEIVPTEINFTAASFYQPGAVASSFYQHGFVQAGCYQQGFKPDGDPE